MRMKLKEDLDVLYWEWDMWKDPYGIVNQLIATILPKNIPFTEDNLKEPHNGLSLAHNEFVWEALETLASAYWPGHDVSRRQHEVIRNLALAYQRQLMDQIRSAFFGCADVLKAFVACPDSAEVARTYSALASAQRPRVSSLTQVEMIMPIWTECSGEISGAFTRASVHMSDKDLVDLLSSLQSVVARMQLIELSVLTFLKEDIPPTAWWKPTITAWRDKVYAMRRITSDYNYRTRWYLQSWPRWTADNDVDSQLEFLKIGSRDQDPLRLETQFCNFIFARLPRNPRITNSRFSETTSSQPHCLSPEAASAARGCVVPTHNSFMDDRTSVHNAAARGHGASTSRDSRRRSKSDRCIIM
ncbi:hypothetical protein SeMB42_g03992 [Synchytrium endobioticum]|uniref:Uncharacterized protein n=1 Tax=Synchytrium endobioticum TaxID=286115 RepID=A0A507D2L7_9FUNG|nr:hypothetical protein SeMB42_g03992 [Synchytrium endobioticum]